MESILRVLSGGCVTVARRMSSLMKARCQQGLCYLQMSASISAVSSHTAGIDGAVTSFLNLLRRPRGHIGPLPPAQSMTLAEPEAPWLVTAVMEAFTLTALKYRSCLATIPPCCCRNNQTRVLTRVQLLALGSRSVTLVICLRKSDSCMPGWEPRRLNWARGLASITWRFTAKPTERQRLESVWIRRSSPVDYVPGRKGVSALVYLMAMICLI